jgi:gluconokinase
LTIVVIMGPSGAGKTTIGTALAGALGCALIEGDAFHPPANVAKMASGQPLTDDDRWPWLGALGQHIADLAAHGAGSVITCSALKRSYRDLLRTYAPDLALVFLDVPASVTGKRVSGRSGHFMPASLIPSQYALLERPDEDEVLLTLDTIGPVAQSVAAIEAALRACANEEKRSAVRPSSEG